MFHGSRRKLLAVMAMCLCVVGTSVPVYAQTVDFNITVGRASSPDPISKRAIKADNEQNFYVTATGCLKGSGYARAYSRQFNGSVFSEDVPLSDELIGRRQVGEYWYTAPSNQYYYMETVWDYGTDTINLVGRYTP